MNYRHAFHAGNAGDVLKHAALVLVLSRLAQKPKPFFVLDAHGGIADYDLAGVEATKTGEAAAGVARIMDAPDLPAALRPWHDLVRAYGGPGPTRYPGSPRLARLVMRPGDRLVTVEKHPQDARRLAAAFEGDPAVRVVEGDAYATMKAMLPPPERRGLVLIDPAYEATDETERAVRALGQGLRRFATGTFMLWYPIKARAAVDRLHAAVQDLGVPDVIAAELLIRSDDHPFRFNGSGLVIVNPTFGLAAALAAALPWLAERLGAGPGAAGRLLTLVPERASSQAANSGA